MATKDECVITGNKKVDERFELTSYKCGSFRAVAINDEDSNGSVIEDVSVGDIWFGRVVNDLNEAKEVAMIVIDMIRNGEIVVKDTGVSSLLHRRDGKHLSDPVSSEPELGEVQTEFKVSKPMERRRFEEPEEKKKIRRTVLDQFGLESTDRPHIEAFLKRRKR